MKKLEFFFVFLLLCLFSGWLLSCQITTKRLGPPLPRNTLSVRNEAKANNAEKENAKFFQSQIKFQISKTSIRLEYKGMNIIVPRNNKYYTSTHSLNSRMETTSFKLIKKKLILSSLLVLSKAINKYPKGFLSKYIEKIYLLGELIRNKRPLNGLAGIYDRTLYIANDEELQKHSFEVTFHHEVAHFLFSKRNFAFPLREWLTLSPVDFVYVGYNGLLSQTAKLSKHKLHQKSFWNTHSTANLSEDFATTAGMMFTKTRYFLSAAKYYPKIRQKVNLAMQFYLTLHPTFTPDYFSNLPVAR